MSPLFTPKTGGELQIPAAMVYNRMEIPCPIHVLSPPFFSSMISF
jgi:hypothetical protein